MPTASQPPLPGEASLCELLEALRRKLNEEEFAHHEAVRRTIERLDILLQKHDELLRDHFGDF